MQTMYRIFLMPNSNGLAETLAILAAKSNGNKNGLYSLSDIQDVAKGQMILYPTTNENTTCELLSDNLLHLDRKIGDNYETVLVIEKVQIAELAMYMPEITAQEAKDILDEINPVLNRQGGITNSNNHENLN